jgi:hypothetical protein
MIAVFHARLLNLRFSRRQEWRPAAPVYLLHQYNKAFAVAGRARHVEGRGLANPITELVDGADDIRIGYAAPGILATQDLNRAGAGNPQRKNTRRAAAAASDLDYKMAASLG